MKRRSIISVIAVMSALLTVLFGCGKKPEVAESSFGGKASPVETSAETRGTSNTATFSTEAGIPTDATVPSTDPESEPSLDKPVVREIDVKLPPVEVDDSDCQHSAVSLRVIREPNCTEAGESGYYCQDCGKLIASIEIPVAGHTYLHKYNDTLHWKTCSKCGNSKDFESHKLENDLCSVCGYGCSHQFQCELTPPTCTTNGFTTYTCMKCGCSYVNGVVSALGHVYAFKSDEDAHWRECAVCGQKTANEKHVMKDGLCTVCGLGCSHTYKDFVSQPTCLERGFITHTCEKCGSSYVDSIIDPTGHNYTSETIRAATCEEQGEIRYSCSKCGDSYTVAISAEGHQIVIDPAVQATCQHTGLTDGAHCAACGAVLNAQTVLPVVEHCYVNGGCIWCGSIDPTFELEPGESGEYDLPLIPG